MTQTTKSRLDQLDIQLIESMSVYKSALGNMSVTLSPNDLDLECYIIAKDGEILRHDTIMWEDSYFMPSARQYVHLYECYPDMDFYTAWEYSLNEDSEA